MEGVDNCVVCGTPYVPRSYAGTAFLECVTCGHGLLADRSRRGDYWADQSASHPDEEYWSEAKQSYFDSALDLLGRATRGRRLVDVGGGVGFFTERALARGWDAYSLDISPSVTALAARRVGAERAWSAFDDEHAGSFDAVSLWCVIAHTTEPSELARLAARALRPGGVVWLTTPNFSFQKPYAALRARLGRPLDFAADDHVGHFTASAVETLLVRAGFANVSFHFRGITEMCVVTGGYNRPLVVAKRNWNRLAFAAHRAGLPNHTSELQVTAVRRPSSEPEAPRA